MYLFVKYAFYAKIWHKSICNAYISASDIGIAYNSPNIHPYTPIYAALSARSTAGDDTRRRSRRSSSRPAMSSDFA